MAWHDAIDDLSGALCDNPIREMEPQEAIVLVHLPPVVLPETPSRLVSTGQCGQVLTTLSNKFLQLAWVTFAEQSAPYFQMRLLCS